MADNENHLEIIQEAFLALNENFLKQGTQLQDLKYACIGERSNKNKVSTLNHLISKKAIIALIIVLLIGILLKDQSMSLIIARFYETRCLVPNNYFVWEFTRPISNCDYCKNVNSALILSNLTKEEFRPYAYTSRPIVVKNAAEHWPARQVFNLQFFRDLYENIEGAYESVDEECQFLHFKSNFTTLREVFTMSKERENNRDGKVPWYVGWKNCHPQVLEIMKQFYDPPHFFPDDAEIPHTNYVFLGYEEGANMHLDYIPRLMWQGQILGSKVWTIAPTPECDHVCTRFNFTVDTGDIILLDTRIWYHGTYILNGKFSLTVASEYG